MTGAAGQDGCLISTESQQAICASLAICTNRRPDKMPVTRAMHLVSGTGPTDYDACAGG
jgi:hypothetical protein